MTKPVDNLWITGKQTRKHDLGESLPARFPQSITGNAPTSTNTRSCFLVLPDRFPPPLVLPAGAPPKEGGSAEEAGPRSPELRPLQVTR